jgi:hypothetical protein
MKKTILIISFLFFTAIAIKAQVDLPRVSPNATVSQTIGYTNINIVYCRPAVKEREIWGSLVPYGQVWRTGANEATTIQITTDALIQGNKVPAGRYALFTIPNEMEWIVILNKTDNQWGAFNYKEADDLLRFNLKPSKSSFTERLQFSFANITDSSTDIYLNWANIQITFRIEIDLIRQMHSKIKEALAAQSDRWQVYAESVNAAADYGVFMDEALGWVDKAISLGGGYVAYYGKARLLFKQNKLKDSLNAIEKCREIGRTDPKWDSFVSRADLLEKQIKEKMK